MSFRQQSHMNDSLAVTPYQNPHQNQAIVLYNQAGPSDEVMQIMKRVVSVRSEEKYRNENVTFLLYIHDNASIKDTLLEEWFITKLQDAELEDGTSSRCLAMRRECKEALHTISMHGNNCPIILPAITFTIFSDYLASRKKGSGAYLSKDSYNGIRSSLCHKYRMSGQVMNTELQRKISMFLSGMKRTVASEKVARSESLNEGKRPMSFAVYSTMCNLMYHGGDDEYLFAHCFLTLEWNLMARSDNCVNMGINHI
jgi:hypothetical protein